ncbi:MarR family winged helix-turn-helix transcriptional regulator [Mangrovimicrobium sediminis]|uniref:MarR family winged helix-turn-helix transcriptional regulator n=1 Tax=Mangrovimicrobium sediminis TaxID=2562682 RepID=UPI001436BA4B|nr:MarR family transcriptional regulator [Haliea sp. SAOS-164]
MTPKSHSYTIVVDNALLAARLGKKLSGKLSPHGISLSEYLVLQCLAATPDAALPRIALAEHLGMSASGVTRMLAPLQKIGLVESERNPRDARQSLVCLSAAGKRVFGEAQPGFADACEDLLAPLSASQQERLAQLLGKVV